MSSQKPKLQVHIDQSLLEDAKRLAEQRERSLSSLIRRLLQQEIKKAKENKEI